jgi:predicted permease
MKFDNEEIYIQIYKPIQTNKIPKIPGTILVSNFGYWVYEKIDENTTKYFYTVSMDVNGCQINFILVIFFKKKFKKKIKKIKFLDLLKQQPAIYNIIAKMITERKLLGLKRPKNSFGRFECLDYFLKQKKK